MGLLNSFESKANFWVVNPQLTIPRPLAELYNSDKSKEKHNSSHIMWAICFLLDPSEENKFASFPEEDRKKLLIEDFLKQPSFKFEEYKDIIDWYSTAILSTAEKSLIAWRKKLEEREKFISETTYSLDTADALDKIMANTDKLFNQLERIEKQYTKEQLEAKDKGGAVASATDRGLI